MKRRFVWLATASIAYGSPHVFSVTDDLLAYPQYEVVFSDSYISDKDARSYLSHSYSSTSPSTSSPSQDASLQTSAELSHRPDTTSSDQTPSSSYELLILNSTPYLCSIPTPPPPEEKNTTTAHRAAEEEAAELARATDRGWDLLQEMSGTCLYFISGWWSYSFCYSNSVKQFHQLPPGKNIPMFPPVEDPTTPSYTLGRFGEKVNRHRLSAREAGRLDGGLPPESGEGSTTTIQAKGSSSSRYLSQKLSGGTTCDLTGSPRRVEIQFHCHPQSADRIGWIKEISTCAYLMVIYTPRLCNDVAFLPPREEKAEQISCREVVAESDIPAYRARKSEDAARALVGATLEGMTGESANKGSGKVYVGGIEVGGMNIVGHDGARLEMPQQVSGNTGSHGHNIPPSSDEANDLPGETIARQDSNEKGGKTWRVGDKELTKRGLDVKTTDAAIRELKEVAQGKGWRLEVVDFNGGRELRGVLDGEDEDEEGQDGEEGDGSVEEYRDEL